MEDNFKFEIGSKYENLKGVYEVISIQKSAMVIRWANGNEIVTTVELQKRILERMDYEKSLQQPKK